MLAFVPGSTHPLGCLNFTVSKAEVFPEAEAAGSRSPTAPDPNIIPSERTHPLCSEDTGTSGTGASSLEVPMQLDDEVPSSGTTAVSMAEGASVGASEVDSPLTAKGK